MVEVAPGWLSDDDFFRNADATETAAPDIAAFNDLWLRERPDPASIVCTVWLKSSGAGTDYYGVIATGGKNGNGFDSPIGEWEAEFYHQREDGTWHSGGFRRMQVTLPR